VRLFERALFLDRSSVAAALNLGLAHARLGQARESRRAFARGAKLLKALPSDAMVAGLELSAAAALRLAEDGLAQKAGEA
jgi:hypothetical protein